MLERLHLEVGILFRKAAQRFESSFFPTLVVLLFMFSANAERNYICPWFEPRKCKQLPFSSVGRVMRNVSFIFVATVLMNADEITW